MDQRARERTPLAIYLEENYCFNLLLFGSSKLEHFHPLHFKGIIHQNSQKIYILDINVVQLILVG